MIKKFSSPSEVSGESGGSQASLVQLVSLAIIIKQNHWLQIHDIPTEMDKSGQNVSAYKGKRLIATKAN